MKILSIGIAILAIASTATAQGALAPADTVSPDDKVASPGTRAEITATQGTSTASISATKTLSNPDEKSFLSWTLTASAPVSKSGDTELVNRESFATDFSLSLKLTRFLAGGVRTGAAMAEAATQALAICGDPVMVKAYQDATGKTDKPQCDTDHVSKYHKARSAEYKALFWDPDARDTMIGFEVEVGRDEFEFLEAGKTETTKDGKTPVGASLFFGWIPETSSTLYTFGVEYEKGYKDQEEKTICNEDMDSGVLDCTEAPFGGPADDNKEKIFFQIRRFTKADGSRAIAPEVSFDFEGDVFEVDFPIYLVADKDKNLRGGIKLGYTSKPDDFKLGVFVGASFTPFR